MADISDYCDHAFSLKTVLMLANEMLSRVNYMHSKGILHRNIKSKNFVIGFGTRSHNVYMIDLGRVAEHRDSNTREPVSYYDGHRNTRVLSIIRYVSLNAYHEVPQRPWDDVDICLYTSYGGLSLGKS